LNINKSESNHYNYQPKQDSEFEFSLPIKHDSKKRSKSTHRKKSKISPLKQSQLKLSKLSSKSYSPQRIKGVKSSQVQV